jgi:SAM-dependent methyltransferase
MIGTHSEMLEDSMVYEFMWDLGSNRLVPVCKRVDKSFQGINGANDLTVAVDVWESMRYPVTKEQLMALPNIGQRAIDRSLGAYPYVGDIYPDYDWKAVFEGRAGDSKLSPDNSDREQYTLRRMHNKIKEHVIKKATQSTKHVSEAQRLANLGGYVLSNFREDSLQSNTRSPCWSLPNTVIIKKTLEIEWGVQIEDTMLHGDRIHIYENVLKQHQAKLSLKENARVVVDLCCGRGGDLKKYVNQKVKVVVGIDNVPQLLYMNKDAALKRWTRDFIGGGTSEQPPDMDVAFVLADVRQPLYNILQTRGIPLETDVICCFFAIHYFFTTELDARSFFQNVKDLLKPDGYFVGTIIDGELLYEKLRQTNNVYHRDDQYDPVDLFSIESANFDATRTAFQDLPDFGTSVKVFIRSSIIEEYVDEPEKNGTLKQENLVKFDTLVALAAEFDLEFQGTQTFDQYFPDIPYIQLSEPVARFSAIHRTFCFRKISKSKDNGTHTIQEIRQSVRTLEQRQLHDGVIEDDRDSNMTYAYNDAYPDDAIVRSVVFVGPTNDDEEGPEQMDESDVDVKEEDPDHDVVEEEAAEEEQPAKKVKIHTRCTTRCAKGECKSCVCKRLLKQQCIDECGCGPNCKNRK